ncbi:MAG: flagellar hook protein FlgE [Alphaproteobacteria bacterium]|nr:flagellar hook protein FlgE [Alphaproteobacteria bacterium]
MVDAVTGANTAFGNAVQGLQNAAGRANQAANNIAQDVNLERTPQDIVDLRQAETEFAANAAVIRTVADTQDKLLDILA